MKLYCVPIGRSYFLQLAKNFARKIHPSTVIHTWRYFCEYFCHLRKFVLQKMRKNQERWSRFNSISHLQSDLNASSISWQHLSPFFFLYSKENSLKTTAKINLILLAPFRYFSSFWQTFVLFIFLGSRKLVVKHAFFSLVQIHICPIQKKNCKNIQGAQAEGREHNFCCSWQSTVQTILKSSAHTKSVLQLMDNSCEFNLPVDYCSVTSVSAERLTYKISWLSS